MHGNSSSYSETGGSSSSTRTSEVNSNTTGAPQSSASNSCSSIRPSRHSSHVLHARRESLKEINNVASGAIERRRINSAPRSLPHVAIAIADDGPSSSIQRSKSAPARNTYQGPTPYLLDNEYFSKCVPLYKAALKGDWNEVENKLDGNVSESSLRAAITGGYQTVLHVATGAKQTNFVKQMLQEVSGAKSLLLLQDKNDNTAFCFAASVGSKEIAEFMLEMDKTLLTIRGGQKMTPLYLAALFGQSEMASFLYDQSKDSLEEDDIKKIFFISMENDLYGFALKLLNENASILAVARHVTHGTALHMLARNPSAFTSSGPGRPQSFLSLAPDHNTDTPSKAFDLLKRLREEIFKLKRQDVLELIREPTKLLFEAAALGNFKFLAELIRSFPDLAHELDDKKRSIFHVAVMHRHADIFNLINEIGFNKELIATYVDDQENNLLHLAAQYSDPKPINKVAGPALEMQQELLTFKEIEMIVRPSFKGMKNNVKKTPQEFSTDKHKKLLKEGEKRNKEGEMENKEGGKWTKKTPWEVFTDEHKMLLKEGEEWMKSRATSCSIVATLVTTVTFQAAFTLPGGNDDDSGTPHFLTKPWFHIFMISNAIAFSCSLFSTLIFLSILITSSYREGDFLMRLPLKLIGGLITLFVSITATALSFSSSIFLAYRDTVNVFTLITIILVFLPIAVYAFQQIRLLGDLLYSMYRLALFLNKVGSRKLKVI